MINYPKISIVTSSYNQGKFIEQTILSVLNQNYPNLEYIIIDGGSTDNSVEIIKKYEDKITYWVSEPDRGQSHAINKGLERSTGEILNWLNSDDILVKGALQLLADEVTKNPAADIYYGDHIMIDSKGNNIFSRKNPPYNFLSLFYGRQLSCQPAVFFKRSVIDKIGNLSEKIIFCMDIDLWIRAAKGGSVFHQIKKPLAMARLHTDAKTTNLQNVLFEEHISILKKYGAIPEKSFINKYHYILLNRFWRAFAAINRCIYRGDFTFLSMSKALKQLTEEKD